MKHLLAILVSITLGCAAKAPVEAPPEPPKEEVIVAAPTLGHTMSLVGKFSSAHACPCDDVVYTAAHVGQAFMAHPAYQSFHSGSAWEDGFGNYGYVMLQSFSLTRDLAILQYTGTPTFQPIAHREPMVGDTIYWQEYDWDIPMMIVTREAKVAQLIAGHIIFDERPSPGASGGCVLDRYGDVVGVLVWGMYERGAAVSLVGKWHEHD